MTKTRLKKYANLIARCGVNVQKGQEVYISAELDQPEFVKMVVDECYKAGAKKVTVDFSYGPLTRSHVKYCKTDVLGTLDPWQIERWEHQAKIIPCKIYLVSEDPDELEGINQQKFAKAMAMRSKTIKPIRAKMENKYQWCIAAVPGKKWAKKIFPNERASKAEELLWEAILNTSRVNDDPIAAWDKHNADLLKRCDYLNSLGIKSLHYTAGNGTDFTVGLIPEATFQGGGENALGSGIYFNPNIPSEEVFTSPMKGEAEGIVYSSRPLCYNGVLIDNFWIKFEGGKAVDVGAEKNEEALRELIKFDENAACHLALGRGFTNLIRGYENMTEEECHKLGINDSIVHEDFMIGTADMSIVATTANGETVQIFKDGEWAF